MIIPCEMQTEICLPTKTRSFSYPPSCSDTSKCWLVIVLYEHCPLFLWNNCYQLYFTKCKIIYKAERVGKSNRNQKKINIALWTCVLLNSSFTLKDYIITLSHMCVFFFLNIYFWSWTSANSTTQENDIYHPESSHYSLLYQFNVEKKSAINQNLQLVF